jgi:CRP-like cAMP-binding protein
MESSPIFRPSYPKRCFCPKDVLIKEVEKGVYLYQPPVKTTPIYEIVSGIVKIGSYTQAGEEVCFDILGSGEFFGNLNYLDGQFFEFSKTLTQVKLRVNEIDYFKDIIINIPEVSEWFNRKVVMRWWKAENRLYSIRSLDVEEKVKKVLTDFYKMDEIRDFKALKKLLTLQDIADLTGLTRQTVSKLLKIIHPV